MGGVMTTSAMLGPESRRLWKLLKSWQPGSRTGASLQQGAVGA
jgi:hypothetical protein